MKIVIPKESDEAEKRVALIPNHVEEIIKMGIQVCIESGLGHLVGFADQAYTQVGAELVKHREVLLGEADMVLSVSKPTPKDLEHLAENTVYLSSWDPYNESELLEICQQKKLRALSVEMIPRITRAQKLDVLSSQANLAGYVMVIIAAERLPKILPMMMTPAGTIAPSRVFVIGAGVAGLQAIATAKRLGARVEAFDTRDVVAEQVQSVGGKFIKIDLGETGQTKDGYAKALTEEQLERQRQGLAKVCERSDIVITTAQIPGKKAPRILTKKMIEDMLPGSVIVDMAVASGGNVEGSEVDKEVVVNGVTVIGIKNLPSRVAMHASQMYSANMFHFIEEFWDQEKKSFKLSRDDDIIAGCLITENGTICNEQISKHYQRLVV